MPCQHANVRLSARGQPFFDSNVILMEACFYCADCGIKFRSVGVPDGVNTDAPGSLAAGLITILPIVPLGEEPRVEKVGRC